MSIGKVRVINKYGYPVVSKEVSDTVYGARHGGGTGKRKSTRLQKLKGEYKDKDGNISKYNYKKWEFLLDAPFEISEKCCNIMKKKPLKEYGRNTKRKPFIGTMASESRLRYQKWIQHGCNAFLGDRPISQPLSFWTEQDVLHYIKEFNVPYAPVYGDIVPTSEGEQIEGQLTTFDILGDYEGTLLKTTGCRRTGCIFCMFGCHLEKEPNRFQRLKATHPKQYEYCIGGGEMVDGKWQPNKEGLGLGKVLDYIDVDY